MIPFNGEHNAGIQILNTSIFPDLTGPLKRMTTSSNLDQGAGAFGQAVRRAQKQKLRPAQAIWQDRHLAKIQILLRSGKRYRDLFRAPVEERSGEAQDRGQR